MRRRRTEKIKTGHSVSPHSYTPDLHYSFFPLFIPFHSTSPFSSSSTPTRLVKWPAMFSNATSELGIPKKSLSSSIDELHRLSSLTTPEKMPRRGRRKRDNAETGVTAVIAGIVLGAGLAALQLQEATPRWSQIPESLSVITSVAATLLIAAALTGQARNGLLCGAIAAISQFLTVFAFHSYSYTMGVAMAVVPYQSLRILTYPAAGIIGGYIASRTMEARRVEPSRRVRRSNR